MVDPIRVVSVIETRAENEILNMTSWPETPEGNQAAEDHFKACAQETTERTDDEIEEALADGILEVGEGAIIITHS